ncbi:MAG: hypothetical protein SNH07_00485 [Rikenellaceae bacterium]
MILHRQCPFVIEETTIKTTETTYYNEDNTLNNNKMTKKIYICGKVYEIDAVSCVAVCKKIQKHIDRICNDPDNGNVNFVTLSLDYTEPAKDGEPVEITFTFKRNNLFAKNGVNPELINDSDGQLIMGMGRNYTPPVLWEYVKPFGINRYHIPLEEFAYAYEESVKEVGATEIQGMRIESSKSEFSMSIVI